MESLDQNLLILIGVAAVVVVLTIIGIMSRYRKCKSDEVLVVYGKTGGGRSAKCYHGGSAFIIPIIQGYEYMSMRPMQIECNLTGALSSQNIRVSVPTTITVAISTDPDIMQNAAERLLGMGDKELSDLITDVVYGQMRLIISDMTIEELNSDRDKFLSKARADIDSELKKFGLYLMNINISDIKDEANYIVNLGKEAAAKATNEAEVSIITQQKLGEINKAKQLKEKETMVAETNKEKDIMLSATSLEKETKVAENNRQKVTQVTKIEADKQVEVSQLSTDCESKKAELEADKQINIAKANSRMESDKSKAEFDKDSKIAELEADKKIKISQAEAKQQEETAKAVANKDASITELNSQKEIRQANAMKDAQVGKNKASEEIAKSDASLKIAKAEAEEKAGKASVESRANVQIKDQETQLEVEKMRTEKERQKLTADIVVPSEMRKKQAELDADAEAIAIEKLATANKNKQIMEAEAEAEMIRKKALADAEGTKARLLAEADGLAAKLNAEVEAKKNQLMAEADGFKAMVDAAENNPQVAVQYKMVDQWKEIVGEQVKAFEHIKLGNITVFDGGKGTTGNFLNNVVNTVAPTLGVLNELPIPDGLKKIIKPSSESTDNTTDEFPDVDRSSKKGKK